MSSSTELIVGLDVGTSAIKAVAFDTSGQQVAASSLPNEIINLPDGGVEQDMSATWKTVACTLRSLAEGIGGRLNQILAIGVTAQGDGTWLVDDSGQPVGDAMLWLDGRAGRIVEHLQKHDVAAEVFKITGTAINPSLQSVQLLWIRQNRPEALNRARTAFHAKEWIYFNLTGTTLTDCTESVLTFGDVSLRRYSDNVIHLLDLQGLERLLPDITDSLEHIGQITATAAKATGLLEGTPVVLGPVDWMASGIGSGLIGSDRPVGCSILGSAGIHQSIIGEPSDVKLGRPVGYTVPFVLAGTWVRMISNMAATLNFDWFTECLEEVLHDLGHEPPERQRLLEALATKADSVPPGSVFFHPFIFEAGERGPFTKPTARAQFFGFSRNAGLYAFTRAIYEGVAFATRDCYEAMGTRPTEIRLGGGGAGSRLWRSIIANVTGIPVRRTRRQEAGAAGVAATAAWAIGVFPSLEDACRLWVTPYIEEPEDPDPELTGIYNRYFHVYHKAYENMFDLWDNLDRARKGG